MKIRASIFNPLKQIICAVVLSTASVSLMAHNALDKDGSIAPMLDKATPAVVNITVDAVKPREAGVNYHGNAKVYKSFAIGSGVIFEDKNGTAFIVTNAHVTKDAKVIIVTLKDGRRFHGHMLAHSKAYDLAIIDIKAKNLTTMPFGNSDKIHVGDTVAAIGSPFGLKQTVTSGVVSALNRDRPKMEGFQNFIQTDAPINPGNSGGALVNMSGQLVGINTAILSRVDSNIGIGFAIPSNMALAVIDQLVKYGEVKKGLLGVMAQNITPELKDAMRLSSTKGALVTQIVPDSPAIKSGLEPKDVIVSVNGFTVNSADQLRNDLGLIRPKALVKMNILRDGKKTKIETKMGDPKIVMQEKKEPFISGVALQDFNEISANGNTITGARIIGVKDNSNAILAGLTRGDIITSINGKSITSATQLKQIADHASKQNLLISFNREGVTLFAVLGR
jgi:serine protease Do